MAVLVSTVGCNNRRMLIDAGERRQFGQGQRRPSPSRRRIPSRHTFTGAWSAGRLPWHRRTHLSVRAGTVAMLGGGDYGDGDANWPNDYLWGRVVRN